MKKIALFLFASSLIITQANAHVDLLTPSGGETYEVGESVSIEWQIAISHSIQNWDLSFSIDNGVTWEPIELDIPSTGNSVGTVVTYDWIVPNTPSNQVKIWVVMDNAGTDYDDQSAAFTINTTLGLTDNWSQAEISLFPNPVKNGESISISYQNDDINISRIQIFDSKGASVKSVQIAQGNLSELKKVDLSGLKSGLYFMILMSNEEAIQRKSFVLL